MINCYYCRKPKQVNVDQEVLIMNSSNKNHKNRLPEWQSIKMRMLIEERWSEVWEIVTARERYSHNSAAHSHLESS